MTITKPSAVLAGLVVGIGALASVASVGLSQVAEPKAPRQATDVPADKPPVDQGSRSYRGPADDSGRNVHVDAPTTNVDVQKDTGKLRVRAPYTDVKVDPDKGHVRVRAPYVDLNIRW